ncbi:non-motile and phage-resistance protein [Variibacter gotjawalensis]|uniref:histidine kinase n=1 Tax=Variibacter gotjawalensis TaxID=1333996 RepID=A0A0S3PYZ8_9BRAD|nr:HAMP domain-containing sensor histidine kinase [Variibacter gotjawalensis]NIK47015.1 two-component system cell cycle sensor histidine kinase PleC [Variibacter gotjawalensis]RZS48919.1 two-component system cell cycle sensor histidine kinase PleC [Variibacter gotjawalensis]BAT61178.1 non-motile and phage-resistance protein [Variibacter gotjawalensis]
MLPASPDSATASAQRDAEAARAAAASPRRSTARRVREARDRLTSSTGTRPAFDQELIRQFASNRISAVLAISILVAAVGIFSAQWNGELLAVVWTSATLCIVGLTWIQCRKFLALDTDGTDIRAWRMRFTLLDVAFGSAWMILILSMLGDVSSVTSTFVLFILLLIIALAAMLSSTLPTALFATTLPALTAVTVYYALHGRFEHYVMIAMAIGAQVYFALIAHRLYSGTLDTLIARAEKDALIGELEQSKANSDEARRNAEEANLAKSRFLAQMSHELRTPLNAILGFSEVMKSEVFGEHSSPIYKEYAGDIHSSGEHLLNLINEILDLSRVEAGGYELKEESVSLPGVVEDCHHLLKMRAQSRSIRISQNFEQHLPRVWADERAVRQIVLNLLSNAIKFTPQGGEIWLKVGWTASGGQYISVRDNGPGIPEDEIQIVLSSFGQGSNAIKSAERGAGLGLPIVNGLIELHGGSFAIKSKLRQGTEVLVNFPPQRVVSALAPIHNGAPPTVPNAEPEPELAPTPKGPRPSLRKKPGPLSA